ncbi:MAG TPA: hypothetical protein VHL98_02160 [Microvirga sp.]|jgi:hypothetical protein|nr:hypothetical protein [Microvirga sp.]
MTNPDETRNGETLAVVTALAAAAGAVLLALIVAAVLSAAPARTGATDPAPGCAEWSDGCVICRRAAEGIACSTPGIACTRGAVQCQRRS